MTATLDTIIATFRADALTKAMRVEMEQHNVDQAAGLLHEARGAYIRGARGNRDKADKLWVSVRGAIEGLGAAKDLLAIAQRAAAPRRLLIVDRDGDTALSYARTFAKMGPQLTVRTVTDYDEALVEVREWRPTHMLCAVDLDNGNSGFDLAGFVLDERPCRVVLMAGVVGGDHEQQAKRCGAVGIVQKDADMTAAVAMVLGIQ